MPRIVRSALSSVTARSPLGSSVATVSVSTAVDDAAFNCLIQKGKRDAVARPKRATAYKEESTPGSATTSLMAAKLLAHSAHKNTTTPRHKKLLLSVLLSSIAVAAAVAAVKGDDDNDDVVLVVISPLVFLVQEDDSASCCFLYSSEKPLGERRSTLVSSAVVVTLSCSRGFRDNSRCDEDEKANTDADEVDGFCVLVAVVVVVVGGTTNASMEEPVKIINKSRLGLWIIIVFIVVVLRRWVWGLVLMEGEIVGDSFMP